MIELAMLSVLGQGMILTVAGVTANEQRFAPVAALPATLIPVGALGAVLSVVLLTSPLGGLAGPLGLALLLSAGLAIYTGLSDRLFRPLLALSALGLVLGLIAVFFG